MTLFDLSGYTIVGDGTTAQLSGILSGILETDLGECMGIVLVVGNGSVRNRVEGARYIDSWPWIFKEYENAGYVTLYTEDEPQMGAFQLRLKGWEEQPTTHYMRPFWLAHQDL